MLKICSCPDPVVHPGPEDLSGRRVDVCRQLHRNPTFERLMLWKQNGPLFRVGRSYSFVRIL
jgi:hypothetical protein